MPPLRYFRQLARLVAGGMAAEQVPCGPGPQVHAAAPGACAHAGYGDVFVARIGQRQDGFFDFHAGEARPRLRGG